MTGPRRGITAGPSGWLAAAGAADPCCVCVAVCNLDGFELMLVAPSATKTPVRQSREAIRTRRLKKADCEVEFVFIGGAALPREGRRGG